MSETPPKMPVEANTRFALEDVDAKDMVTFLRHLISALVLRMPQQRLDIAAPELARAAQHQFEMKVWPDPEIPVYLERVEIEVKPDHAG